MSYYIIFFPLDKNINLIRLILYISISLIVIPSTKKTFKKREKN